MTTRLDQDLKRSLTPEAEGSSPKRICSDSQLLTELTGVLAEIKSTPSTGELSPELLGTLRLLMLRIERLSADETNVEARRMKDESEKCLETWFAELVERCEADGELDLDALEFDCNDSEDDDEEDALALALALQDEEDAIDDAEAKCKEEGSSEVTGEKKHEQVTI